MKKTFSLKRPEPSKQLKTTEVSELRESILKEQNGICPLCNDHIFDAVLDHSHKKRTGGTGKIRGVLCRNCNSFLAKSENNCTRFCISQKRLPDVLRRMAEYLEKPHLPFTHPSERTKPPKLQKSSYSKLKKIYTGKSKFPEYPKSGQLTVKLKALYEQYNIEPNFYSN